MSDYGKVFPTLEENVDYVNSILPVEESFDIIQRDVIIGERQCTFYFVDGFTKDETMQKLMSSFFMIKKEDMPSTATGFSKMAVSYVEVDVITEFDEIFKNILSGVACLFVEGYEACIAIDCRTYPARSVDEPEKDKALRGSRDGFVETIVFNTALMRRRIRDPHLVMKMFDVGRSSRTDVTVCYMSDRVDKKLLESITDKIVMRCE